MHMTAPYRAPLP